MISKLSLNFYSILKGWLVFPDFLLAMWGGPTSCWKIKEYQSHPSVCCKNSNVPQMSYI